MEILNHLSLRQSSMCHMIQNQMILSHQTCATCLNVCHLRDLGDSAKDKRNSDFLISIFWYLHSMLHFQDQDINAIKYSTRTVKYIIE